MTATTELTQEAAQAEADRLDAEHRQWTEKRDALAGQLAERQASGARAALAGGGTAKVAADLGRLREELALAEGALVILDEQRRQAARRVRAARIADERRAIAALEAELAEREGRYRELAGALAEYEGLPPGTVVVRGRTAALAARLAQRRRGLEYLEERQGDADTEGMQA